MNEINNIYPVNLTLIPATLDLWHICLIAMVLFLFLVLIIIVLVGSLKKAKPVEPEIKIIEKIVEVEKIVEIPAPEPEPVILKQASSDAALQLLAMLQKEARFIDFIKEDVNSYNDADVGVAARVVHEGCNKVLNEYFTLDPVRTETEGSNITLAEGFDATEIRLTGNVVGEGSYTGILVHKGWKVTDVRLPKLTEGHNTKIVATAEIEL